MTLQSNFLPETTENLLVPLLIDHNLRNKPVVHDVLSAEKDFKHHIPFQRILQEVSSRQQ
jgi:hypothetical protein